MSGTPYSAPRGTPSGAMSKTQSVHGISNVTGEAVNRAEYSTGIRFGTCDTYATLVLAVGEQ